MSRPSRARIVQAAAAALLTAAIAIPATSTTASAAPSPTDTTVRGINVDTTTIPRLESLMNRDRLTSQDLVSFYLSRIRQLNSKLHAVITVNKSALDEARAADRARSSGDRRPMLGIPVIVKDNIDTTGMPTTAGSLALDGSTPRDAFIVKRLKKAGALIIGKANLSEWANFRSTQSSSGWSAEGGQTNSAYALDRNPCGSSSGSAVAASADLATVAIGTETDGSIVCPSGQNGDVGIKPTLGLASRAGIVPISEEQDTAGPITRNVTDAAVVLGAITGVDPNDNATSQQTGHVHADYTPYLRKNALKGARIGVWRKGNFGVSPETDTVMRRRDRAVEVARRNDRRPRQHPHRRRVRARGHRAQLRVQARHRALPADLHGGALPADAVGLDRVRPRTPQPGDALFRPGAIPSGPGQPGDHEPDVHQSKAAGDQHGAQGDQRHPAQVQPRRDHRADELPRLDDRSDQR